jgi:type IX secretion system PorP/SprF family membrane protein
MKKVLILIFILVNVVLRAQQFSMSSQPNRDVLYVNPAFTGYYETTVASLMNRTNWVGMPGAVQYQDFELHAPLKKQSVAIGVQAMHQQIGSTSANEIFFNYCHRISFENSKLAFALKMGFTSTSMGNVSLRDEADLAFVNKSFNVPNFGVGLSYYSKSFYVGISIPYLLGSSLSTDGNVGISSPDINDFNYILTLGGKIPIGTALKLEPHALMVYSMVNGEAYTGILNFNLSDRLLVGGGYSSVKAIIGNLGYYLNRQISLQYSYDYNIGQIGKNSSGSHEISLLFYFGYKIKTSSPRDF